jgi:amino acid adenylation domain-containing protein
VRPQATAVVAGGERVTYAELDRLANQVARALAALDVRAGDRVAIWMEKSHRAVAAMQGALRLGAAYVPIDPLSPVARAALIASGCAASALVCGAEREQLAEMVLAPCLDWARVTAQDPAPLPRPSVAQDDLAYVLYTSGSTGTPKGVCLSHGNALAFIDWAAGELQASAEDRFSNHAPFHFDLSVLDLYVAFAAGASVHLVSEKNAYLPGELLRFIAAEHITVWYSVPSALVLMLEHGGLTESVAADLADLRAILFAGETFPIKHLRRLRHCFPAARLLNLYGPTETNVCTFHEVHAIAEQQSVPVPIGRACSGDRVWAVDAAGRAVEVGGEGELLVSGPTVMLGYWGEPPQGNRPYSTGDLVRRISDDRFEFVGRRDHMVKVRGHRIELGEIEATLLAHPAVRECAVLVLGGGIEARLVAFVVPVGQERPGLLAMKAHCAARLPRYMIIDKVRWLESLPRTNNGKIDREALRLESR